MRSKCFIVGVIAMGLGLGSASVYSQNYPTKPVRIVTSEAGGGTNFVSRLIAQGVSPSFGQQIIVDNRASALTGETVARAAPDGYTLLLNGTGFWLAPLLQVTPSYDSVKDFSPISLVTTSPNLVVVHPSLPVKSIKELIALAKSKPGALNYGSSATGTPTHLGAEMFNSMAGVKIVRVPYRGNGPALNALVGGEVQLMFPGADGVLPHVKSGKVRALAVTSAQPSALLPGVPTVAATVPGYQAAVTYGLLAPAGTPVAIINRWNQEVVKFLNTPDTKERLFNTAIEVVGSSPQQLGAVIKSDLAVWGKVMKDAGIHPE